MKLLKIAFWGLVLVVMLLVVLNELPEWKLPQPPNSLSGPIVFTNNKTNTTLNVEVLVFNATTIKNYVLRSNLTYNVSDGITFGNGTFNDTLWRVLTADPWNVTYDDYVAFTDMARILTLKDAKGSLCKTYRIANERVTVCNNESAYFLAPYNGTTGYFLKISHLEYPKYKRIPYVPSVDFFPFYYDYDDYIYVYVTPEYHSFGDKYVIDYYLNVGTNKTKCGSLVVDLDKAGVYEFKGGYYLGIGPLYWERVVVVRKDNFTQVDTWETHSRELVLPIKHFIFDPYLAWISGSNDTRLDLIAKINGKIVKNETINLKDLVGKKGVYVSLDEFNLTVDSRDLIRSGLRVFNLTLLVNISDDVNLYGMRLRRGYTLFNYTVRLTLNGSLGKWDSTTEFKFNKMMVKVFQRPPLPSWAYKEITCESYPQTCQREDDYLSKLILWAIFNRTYETMSNYSDFNKYFAITWLASYIRPNESIHGLPSEVCLKCLMTGECPSWGLSALQRYMYMGLLTNTTETEEIYVNGTNLEYDVVNVTYILTGSGVKEFPHVNTSCGLAYLVEFKRQHSPCALKYSSYYGSQLDMLPYIYEKGTKVKLVRGLVSKPFNLSEEVKACIIEKYDSGYYAEEPKTS